MAIAWLLNLLFPVECLGCRAEGDWLCPACLRRLRPASSAGLEKLNAPHLDKIFIAGDYDDPLLQTAIKKFKYGFLAGPGKPLGRFLGNFWQGQLIFYPSLAPGGARLLPIPLSSQRQRWRGFNQAEILARELSDIFGYEIIGAPDCLFPDRLSRQPANQPQANLNEAERQANIRGAFTWSGDSLKGQTIILIDDVVTTGATLSEAAKILKTAGAGHIYGLALAKG